MSDQREQPSKLKIRIIDSKDRGLELYQRTQDFNSWDRETSRKRSFDPAFRESDEPGGADLVLCHMNDLHVWTGSGETRQKQPNMAYIEECSRKKIMVVLYSGDLRSSQEGNRELTVETNDGTWQFSLDSPDYVLVVPYNVLTASRLPIETALRAFAEEPDPTKKREALFSVLREFNPVLEAKLELLYFLEKSPSRECAESWEPPEIPGLTDDDKNSLRSRATEFFKVLQEPQTALRKLRDELLRT